MRDIKSERQLFLAGRLVRGGSPPVLTIQSLMLTAQVRATGYMYFSLWRACEFIPEQSSSLFNDIISVPRYLLIKHVC